MKTSLIIPAKGTSERVKNKNLQTINGKTLVRLACEKALQCKEVDFVYLDTECPKIKSNVLDLERDGLRFIDRPKALATNDCTANDLLIWALHSIEECDLICQTFATSPLITSETIDKGIKLFIDKNTATKMYSSFFSVVPVQEYFWEREYPDSASPLNFDPKQLPNSQNLDIQWMETHGIYGVFTDSLIQTKTRMGEFPMLYQIPANEALDIDDEEDLELARKIMR